MSINNLPTEVFVEILEHIPTKDASSILRVNKEWYREYRYIVKQNFDTFFEALLYSESYQWYVPSYICRWNRHFNWDKFIRNKVVNICQVFDIDLKTKL